MQIYDQHSMTVQVNHFKNLYEFDNNCNLVQPFKIVKNEEEMPFLMKFERKPISFDYDMFETLQCQPWMIVILFAQVPNLDLIKYLENKCLQLIIQLPYKSNYIDLRDRILDKISVGAKENRLAESIPELILGKIIKNKQHFRMADLIVLQPEVDEEGRQYVYFQTLQILKLQPSKASKLVFLLQPQWSQADLIKLSSILNQHSINFHENMNWIKRLLSTCNNRNMVVVKKSDQKIQNQSQFALLSTHKNQTPLYNLTLEGHPQQAILTGFHNNKNTLYLSLKVIVQSDPLIIQYFANQIFFIKKLEQQCSQFDEYEAQLLTSIIVEASFVSCCLCTLSLQEEEDFGFESLAYEAKYNLYLQILVGSGILSSDQSCQLVQQIYKKILNKPIMEIQISRNYSYNLEKSLSPYFPQEAQGTSVDFYDPFLAESPRENAIIRSGAQSFNAQDDKKFGYSINQYSNFFDQQSPRLMKQL